MSSYEVLTLHNDQPMSVAWFYQGCNLVFTVSTISAMLQPARSNTVGTGLQQESTCKEHGSLAGENAFSGRRTSFSYLDSYARGLFSGWFNKDCLLHRQPLFPMVI